MNPAEYDAWYATPRGRWIGEAEHRLLRGLLEAEPGETLLDVGCGTGWFTRRFAAGGLEATGLDPDAAALDWARAHSGDRLRWIPGDARALPFGDAAFDRVVSVTALCFVDDWRAALAEIARVARRRFAVGLLNRASLLWREKGQGGGAGAYRGAYWHRAAELREALAALPVERVAIRTAVFVASGSALARAAEAAIPARAPWGAFLAVAASPRR